jgi:predicted secreted protein
MRGEPREGIGAVRGRLVLPMLVLLCACAAPERVMADDDGNEPGHRVRFRVESSREVANDWIVAMVGITAEDADSAALAATVNESMAWALDQAKREKKVKAKSGGYQTYPVHEKGKLRRWRASQTLLLEGADVDAMTELVGTLQTRLQLQGFNFSVARETREKVQEELVTEVLAAFQKRAELVRKNLGAGGYAIDDLSIDTGHQAPVRHQMMEARSMSAAKVAPAVEGGQSLVSVSAHGAIVLE